MAARRRAALKPKVRAAAPRPLVYTAQDVARFCEVDLKTIHHWADAGKIAHHRTEGRHLRFRRNHVVRFLRRHGYPLHAELVNARPTVFYAVAPGSADAAPEEIAKRLSSRFVVRRFGTVVEAIAHLVAGEPDAIVASLDDATWAPARALAALKGRAETSWTAIVVVTDDATGAASDVGADLIVARSELTRLGAELARELAVD